MKQIPQIITSTLIVLSLMFTACKKQSVTPQLPPPQPQQPTGKLSKLIYDTGAYDSLYYLADGRISKLVNNIDTAAGDGVNYEFKYDATGRRERINSSEGWYYLYQYTNGKVTTISQYINQHKSSYKFFNYTNDVLTSMEIYNYNGAARGYEFSAQHSYSFYPDDNLKKEVTHVVDGFTGQLVKHMTVEYLDYDNKFNAEELIRQIPYYYGIVRMKNNPGKRIVKRESNGVITTFNSQFTYDQQAKPLTKKFLYQDPSGGVIETNTLFYYY
ncbi:MAG: hypothetical protein U1C70_07745 [Sediminibacterium sp.]|jgi:hypothetical protein|uniref:hypothetical protein n=1 Tax=Sediminibacterium sp. TaxID=1917865 RepID=UPI002ABA832B|nr:hypothetical protein [Sediminibacterium sp.]MDZ4071701.1 hypothetical protein [Sediminibacterium sp.]